MSESTEYVLSMRFFASRRLFALIAAMALTLAFLAHGVRAAEMGAKMLTAAVADLPAPDDCDGCGGDDGMPVGTCYAVCGGDLAILPSLTTVAVHPVQRGAAPAATANAGRENPPDPQPPRPAVVS